jgi:hypothetical protein
VVASWSTTLPGGLAWFLNSGAAPGSASPRFAPPVVASDVPPTVHSVDCVDMDRDGRRRMA